MKTWTESQREWQIWGSEYRKDQFGERGMDYEL